MLIFLLIQKFQLRIICVLYQFDLNQQHVKDEQIPIQTIFLYSLIRYSLNYINQSNAIPYPILENSKNPKLF
jgi:hypothetical protein